MAFLGSLFLGRPGDYNIWGFDVHFGPKRGNGGGEHVENESVKFAKQWSLHYLHNFIHEMGHALAAKWCGYGSSIHIYTDALGAHTHLHVLQEQRKHHKFICFCGPLAGFAFETMRLVAAIACAFFVPYFGVQLAVFLGMGAILQLYVEVSYALSTRGDWGVIKGNDATW